MALSDISVVKFNGINQFLLAVDDPALEIDVARFSICLWVKIDVFNTPRTPIFAKWDEANDDRSYYLDYDNVDEAFIFGSSTNGFDEIFTIGLFPFEICDGVWHHVSITFNGFGIRIFIDGFIVGASVINSTIHLGDAPLVVGRRNNVFLNGSITNVCSFDTDLVDEETRQVREASNPTRISETLQASLKNWWLFRIPQPYDNLVGQINFAPFNNPSFVQSGLPTSTVIFDQFLGEIVRKNGVCYEFQCIVESGEVADPVFDTFENCIDCVIESSSSSSICHCAIIRP